MVTNDMIAASRRYGLDVLGCCVPNGQITNENLKGIRWPQIQRAMEIASAGGSL